LNQPPEQREPWLRGILPGIHPVIGHLLRSSQQIREDLTNAIRNLTPEQLWTRPNGTASAGFHARHLAGSTHRLCTYMEGAQLSGAQLDELRAEQEPGEPAAALIAGVESALERYENLIRQLTPAQFGDIREVGRQRLQTTAISLAIHIAEHAHRHTGQAITTAKAACSAKP
jgi:uncharacterized damage-inducible protein DinB